MKTSHLMRRQPVKSDGFSWGRFPLSRDEHAVSIDYRLFRRDHDMKLHYFILTFGANEPRSYIAERVRAACHRLRDKVDEIDLKAMGVIA